MDAVHGSPRSEFSRSDLLLGLDGLGPACPLSVGVSHAWALRVVLPKIFTGEEQKPFLSSPLLTRRPLARMRPTHVPFPFAVDSIPRGRGRCPHGTERGGLAAPGTRRGPASWGLGGGGELLSLPHIPRRPSRSAGSPPGVQGASIPSLTSTGQRGMTQNPPPSDLCRAGFIRGQTDPELRDPVSRRAWG